MIDNQETQGKIAAEVRDLSKCIKHKMELGDYISVPMPTVYGKPLDVYYAELADRIDAAAKREVEKLNSVIQATVSRSDAEIDRLRREVAELKKQPGNAAKLREAVVLALSLLDLKEGVPYKTVSQKDIDFMKAALAAPSRNCDVGSVNEQSSRHMNFCHQHPIEKGGCHICPCEGELIDECVLKWAQMPYEKGGAK